MNRANVRISVLIASRGNSSGLRTAIGSLDTLASGKNEINYIVACDFDDAKTQEAITRMNWDGFSIQMACGKRRASLGSAWNEAAFSSPADIYAFVIDRSIAITPLWDAYIADAFDKDDTRITWWTTNNGPLIPIVPHKWLTAAGHIFTGYFPFWFDDTWLHELSALVHGLPNYMIQASCFINKKRSPVTKRLRDLRFWMDFFISKRPERIAHAEEIRKRLGLPEPNMISIHDWFKSNDDIWEKDWKRWEDAMGDRSEPDETYIIAKKAAEAWMYA